MKKIIILILMLFPLVVNANVKVTNHLIDAEIEIGGALNVKEIIIVEGDADSFFRTLNYYSFGNKHWSVGEEVNLNDGTIYNGSSVSISAVSAYELGEDEKIEFDSFNKNVKQYFKAFDLANPSDKTYIFEDKKDGTATLKINYPTNNKKTVFYINYVVSNVVVKHNDVKEINYTFKNLNYNSSETLLRVVIPYETQSELYHVWVHGNQSGTLQELIADDGDRAGVFVSFPNVGKSVNFRMTLPQEHVGVDIYLNRSNIDALDKIIDIEDGRIEQTNKSISILNVMHYVLISLGILYLLLAYFIYKFNNQIIFIIYTLFGLFICVFNYLFRFNYWYLYLVILIPILIKVAKKYLVK